MKKIMICSVFMLGSVGVLFAAPKTTVQVTHPTTQATVHVPQGNTVVTHPVTTVPVTHPTTAVTVTHPTTMATPTQTQPSAANSGGKMASGGDYASYKNAKTFSSSSSTPQAAKLGQGESGLGKDPNADQKAAAAAAFSLPKAQSSQLNVQEVLKNTQLPSGSEKKLKSKMANASHK